MRPVRVTATNYRSFEHLDFTFPNTVAAVAGPNGAGKTSLVQLTDVILFADGGRELGAMLREGAEEMVLELEFEHAGGTYRVRRTYREGKSAKVDLERYVDEEIAGPFDGPSHAPEAWEPLTRETTGETQKAITQLLGFDRDAFHASAMSAQGDGDAFTTAGPADRKKVLASILGLDIWDTLRDYARRDLADQQQRLQRLDGADETARQLADQRPEAEQALATAKTVLTTAEQTLEHASGQLEHAQAADRQVAVARAHLAEARTAKATADHVLDQLAALRYRANAARLNRDVERNSITEHEPIAAQADTLQAEWDALADQDAKRRDLIRDRDQATAAVDAREQAIRVKQQEAERLLRAATNADEHADRILAEPAGHACDRCGQTLGDTAADNAIASLRADAVRDRQAADDLETVIASEQQAIEADRTSIATRIIPTEVDHGDLQERVTQARTAAGLLAAARARLEQHERVAAEWTDDHAHRIGEARQHAEAATAAVLEAEQAMPADADVIRQAVTTAEHAVSTARTSLDTAREQHIRATTRLEHITRADDQLAASHAERTSIQERVDLLTIAERCYGPNGVPALIVENTAIPQIETDANEYLQALGTSYQVELRTQRDLKTSEAKKETLDIVVHTPAGERDYTTFSGGERTRVDVALRIALARLLAHRAGANSELLVIDEPDGLDVEGMERLAGILRGLLGDFTTVLVVSHNPALGAAFETVIQVDRDGDTSRVLEAVAA